MNEELYKAKKELYKLLLQMPQRDMSAEEVDMMYTLSQDASIKSRKEVTDVQKPG